MDLRPESSFLKKPFSELHREGLHRKNFITSMTAFREKPRLQNFPERLLHWKVKGAVGSLFLIPYAFVSCAIRLFDDLQKTKRAVKNSMFLQPLKNAGGDSGIFNGILIGYALRFVEISLDDAAK